MPRLLLTLALLLALCAPARALPRLAVHTQNPGLATHLQELLKTHHPRLRDYTGASPRAISIHVAADRGEFNRLAAEWGGPDWAAGLAWPLGSRILLLPPAALADPEAFDRVALHELAHLYLHQALRGAPAPRWLEEGLAMHISGEGIFPRSADMTAAVLSGELLPIGGLDQAFREGAGRARLAYAQSYFLFGYITRVYGPDTPRRLIAALAGGKPLTGAVQRATGSSLARLGKDFRADMRFRFGWVALLASGGFLWALAALLAAVGLVWQRRAMKKRLKTLAGAPAKGGELSPGTARILAEAGLFSGEENRKAPTP